MDHLSIDTVKMAEIAINGEAFEKKAKNTIEHLRSEFAKIKPQSDQSREFAGILGKELTDIEEAIAKKLKGTADVAEQFKAEIEKLENSDEIFAAARASVTQSKKTGKVKIER